MQRRVLIKEYQPWIRDALANHIRDGYSVGSFSGRYGVDVRLWIKWCNTIPELVELNSDYKHYLKKKRSNNMKITFEVIIPDDINISAEEIKDLKKCVYGYAEFLIKDIRDQKSHGKKVTLNTNPENIEEAW